MKMKRIVALSICLLMLIPCFTSCSKPPEYSEIEDRFRELVEASGEINEIFFGEGLPTYERITDPKSSTEVIVETTTDEDGTEKKIYHYYYRVPDKEYDVLYAYRKSYKDDYIYLSVVTFPIEGKEAFYADAEKSLYAYVVEGYAEPEYEFFYTAADPEYYDYVRGDCKYSSVAEIKAAAEKVYSKEYLDALYETMFVGSVSDNEYVEATGARYIEYADDEGNISLMMANDMTVFITETRQYDFSTAKIVKPSNADYVTIEIESYLPSKPEARLTVKLSMILQDGEWMLDSATY